MLSSAEPREGRALEFFYILLFVLMVFAIWRMWRQRNGVYVAMNDTAFDKTEGHPDAHEAFDRLRHGQWSALTAIYWRQEPSDRSHLLQGLGELAGAEPVNWPEDADSAVLTMRAAIEINQAWRKVKADAIKGRTRIDGQRLTGELSAAHKLLVEAATRNPRDSANLALQIETLPYVGGDAAKLNSLLGRIEASEEHNIFAAANHLALVSPRAFGSISEMWKTANDYASDPPNAAWFAIPALAHIEEWSWAMDTPPERENQIAQMQDNGFIQHIRKLDAQFWQRTKAAPMSRAEAHFAHNHFAFLLQMMKIDDLLAAHLEAIGPYISRSPWGHLPEGTRQPTRLLAELRKRAGLREAA